MEWAILFFVANILFPEHRPLRTCSVILSFWGKERIITLVLQDLNSTKSTTP